MSASAHLLPRRLVPDLSVPLVGGPKWRLRDQKPKHFTMLIFYRGRHCGECRSYLVGAQEMLPAFKSQGVSVIALSGDTEQRALATEADWDLRELPLAYGVTLRQANAWGLYVSAGHGATHIGVEEPPFFIEPGLFLVRPDRSLFFASIQNMPFARPVLADVLRMIAWTVERHYPARGEVEGLPPEC